MPPQDSAISKWMTFPASAVDIRKNVDAAVMQKTTKIAGYWSVLHLEGVSERVLSAPMLNVKLSQYSSYNLHPIDLHQGSQIFAISHACFSMQPNEEIAAEADSLSS